MMRVAFLISYMLVVTASAEHGTTKLLVDQWTASYRQATAGVINGKLEITPQPDGKYFVFRLQSGNGWKFLLCTTETGARQPAFDHGQLAQELKQLLGRDFQADKLPLQEIQFRDRVMEFRIGNTRIRKTGDQLVKYSLKKNEPRSQRKPSKQLSPDGKWRAFTKDGSVHLKNVKNNKVATIIVPTIKDSYFHGAARWNADSTHFIINHIEPGQRRVVTLVESSPKGSLQPKLHEFRYDKPGDKIDRREPYIFSIDGKTVHQPDPSLTKNAYSIGHASWSADGKEMIYEYVERGFGKHYLIAMDAITGKERIIAKEESDTFIFIGGTRYRKDLNDTGEIIWGSLRDGWRHLYLLDSKTGKVKHQITQGDWVVRSVETVDIKNRQIIFQASGKNPGEDPYHIHWYRVNFDGSGLTNLTEGDGTHQLKFLHDGKYYVDTWSRVDQAPVHELRRASDGKLIQLLAKADAGGLIKQGRALPQRLVCKDRNGRFDIWGVIFTPPNFDPKKQYPIIENIYAGPHGAFATKQFSPWINHINELTEEGFIVVQVDGLGTNYRHRDFSHFSYKNLVDSGFPDRIKWIKEAAKKHPYMDLSRVGIYGGSAGGQSSTGAVLHHGDFYKAAASDCGCHDNRMDKIWWNEQWMDWPVGKHYVEQSNITNAHKLTGALMLTVGELDKNVDPASTTQLVAALTKADKDFEYYIAPSGGHGSGEKAYLRRKRFEFFKHHLGSTR